jgi:hypothetical protein
MRLLCHARRICIFTVCLSMGGRDIIITFDVYFILLYFNDLLTSFKDIDLYYID